MPDEKSRFRWESPAVVLGIALGLAAALAAMPAAWTNPVRNAVSESLRGGQSVAGVVRVRIAEGIAAAGGHWQAARRLQEVQQQVDRLTLGNARLAAALAAADRSPPAPDASTDDSERLLRAQCQRATVLGQLSRGYLARHYLLDAGESAGVEPDNLVLDLPPLLDHGADARLVPGLLALSGRRVFGKIARTSAHTSVVQTVAAKGFRELAQIGPTGNHRGIWEGNGEPAARIRLVELGVPVAVGDLVYVAADRGVVAAAPLLGRISRVERPGGATHWDIWAEPAIGGDLPEQLDVLRIELGPRSQQKGGTP